MRRDGEDGTTTTDPQSVSEAIRRGLDLFRDVFGARYGATAVSHFEEIMGDYDASALWQAARNLSRSSREAPRAATWAKAAEEAMVAAGRSRSIPWFRPPWSSPVAPGKWGCGDQGGFFGIPSAERPSRAVFAFDALGRTSETGKVEIDPMGYLVFAPLGQRPADMPDWNRGPPLRGELVAIVEKIGRSSGARYHHRDLPEGVSHVSAATLRWLGTIPA